MAVVEIVFDDDGTLVPLVLDAAIEERHRMGAIATEHPVERGVAITDHVRPERRTLTVQVAISDTPIRATRALGGSVRPVELDLPGRRVHTRGARRDGEQWEPAEVQERAAPPIRAQVFHPDSEPTRVRDSWELLLRARDNALLAVVTTGLETYEDMVLTEAVTNRTAADGSWIKADLTFAQVRRVATQLVDDPTPIRPRDRRQVNRGTQSTEEVPASQHASTLYQGREFYESLPASQQQGFLDGVGRFLGLGPSP